MNPSPASASGYEPSAKSDDQDKSSQRWGRRAADRLREKQQSDFAKNHLFSLGFPLELDLTREFAKNHTGAALAIIPFAIVIAATTTIWVSIYDAALWVLLVLFASLWQYRSCSAFLLEYDITPQKLLKSIKKLILSEISIVSAWCLLPTIVGIPSDEGMRLFLLFSTLIMCSILSVLSHTIPASVYGSTLPVATLIVQLVVDKEPSERWFVAGLSFMALLLFVGLAQRLYNGTLANIRARAEKDELLAVVEESNTRLRQATREAEQASAAKSHFLATMSHELRTPLNAILGFSEVMKGELFGPLGSEQYRSYAEDIHDSGSHLLELINEVLDLSRIEAGKHELNETEVDFVELVENCCHLLELRAKNRSLTLETAFTSDMPKLKADERALRQITLNLLSNAIKFTPQGSAISVAVGWTASGGQYLSVRDNGSGIPENEIATVLSTFGRGSRALKNADQGSGLGLPIVKGLMELHGGTFVLRSKLGIGTEVMAKFPASRVMPHSPAEAAMPYSA